MQPPRRLKKYQECPFFTLVTDKLTREFHDGVLWFILFADDIVLVDETMYERSK